MEMNMFYRMPGYLKVAALVLVGCSSWVVAASAPHRLVPAPQQVQWSNDEPVKLGADQVAIVLGTTPSEPERYAADTLRSTVARRHGVHWPIVTAEPGRRHYAVEILLGQRSTHPELDAICSKMNIGLGPDSPGHDGYVIEFVPEDSRQLVIVGGSNARAVIYGQDTLFQMITGKGADLALVRASIRDWPSIPWRGRPQTTMQNYFRPGELDCYAASRINFIDLREGIYATEPGEKLDPDTVKRTVAEARKRGMVVFAIVNCGIKREQFSQAIDSFREAIAMGADGLWISFDDKGPGEDPVKLVTDVLALGRAHGITGAQIAVTPPKGSYQTIDDDSNGDFNRKVMQIPGMEQALWFWTPTPTLERLAEARRIGLKTGVSWWHNWPRPLPGFTHTRTGGSLLNSGNPYNHVMPLREGWNRPTYDVLADAGRCTAAVMPWGGNTWGAHYLIPVIGWWAWNPAGHDWNALRARIYDTVFGPELVEQAVAFDDTLIEVKSLFRYSIEGGKMYPLFPARLNRLEDRERALALLARLEELHKAISAGAARQSMLPKGLLDKQYLLPMAVELRIGRAAATAPYPEYWYPAHQRELLTALHAGRLEEVDRLADSVRERLNRDLDSIRAALGHLSPTDTYVQFWAQRAAMRAADWQKMMADRQEMLEPHLKDFGYYIYDIGKMLANLAKPPLRWSSGAAGAQSVVRATVAPQPQELFWGKWQATVSSRKGGDVTCFWMARDGAGTRGDYAELPVEIPVSGRRDSLHLLLYLAHWNRESLGRETVINRWAGHRVIQLIMDGRTIWQADIGVHRTEGEWFLVDLPTLPEDMKTLNLRLRVEDVRDFALDCTVFVGPIRLVEITR
jgi:hypothetical protein